MTDEPGTTPEGPTGSTPPALSAVDAEALDALIDAAWDLSAVPSDIRPRAERVAGLLGLLGSSQIDGREARIARAVQAAQGRAAPAAELSTEDREALDAWVLAGFDSQRVPAALRDRAEAHQALAGLVNREIPVSSQAEREDLIARTLAGVEQARESADGSYKFVEPAGGRNRWADFLSVAAVMLIAASILWPVLSTVRDSARRTVCESNMLSVARGMGAYTNEYDDTLPMTTSGFGGGTWWNVGRDPKHSNSANLYTLARQDYVGLEEMACPGNPQAITAAKSPTARDWPSLEKLSYSYRVMARPERSLWGTPAKLVVVSDRSPVILRAVRQETIFPGESSPNHVGRGQHGLFADGSAQWMTSPVLPSGDNIWLPKPIEVLIDFAARRQGLEPLEGTEAPADRQDSFVGP